MVIELKPKCYTCLDPIAPAGPADLTCFQGSDLDYRSKAHRLDSIIDHQHTTIGDRHTRSKQSFN
jgi:hypothetical protein